MITCKVRDSSVIRGANRAMHLIAMIGLFLIAVLITEMPAAAATPSPTFSPAVRPTKIIHAQTSCDARGCFTFGPRQSYHRPSYRPLGQTGPRYYSPRGAGPQRFIYRPQPPTPLPQARLPAADPSFHRQSCMNRYRSYDPLTDSYVGSGRKRVRCVLPERR
jgi:hypothetical protein